MIRSRTPADLPALERVLHEAHETDSYPTVWPTDPAAFLTPPSVGEWAVGEWMAEDQGQVVGQVVLRPVTDPAPGWVRATELAAPEVLILSRLFVAPAARGRGPARGLLRTAWQEALNRRRRAILDVHHRNWGAIRLYEAAGWRRVATVGGDWTEPDGKVPQVHVYVAPEHAAPSLNPT
ncbi:GNAT family N-acetyltransferase [Deinococcus sp. NW-56]|uniref:GNAT family N-acetyltransferase n=1 Tax=Deinococcus sp. NW-56 TaxID=2080419 RepID=UPI000CF4E3DB|nr:GNAT family N-acetyltransferase [Deinococcus sp. NW-56]